MSCCGGRRQAHRALLSAPPVRLKYLDTGSTTITGPATGTLYEFSALNLEVYVDPRDAMEFLKTPSFALVG
jgi:hypothetical protein